MTEGFENKMMQQVYMFSEIFGCLHSGLKEAFFMDMELTVVESDHPLIRILPKNLCSLPCVIARNKNVVKTFRQQTWSKGSTRNPSLASQSSDCDSEITLEGSPLKLHEITDINHAEDSPMMKSAETEAVDQRPVSVRSARKILSYYHQIHTSLGTETPDYLDDVMPLWVVTDAKNVEKIAYFGSLKINNVIKTVRVTCSTISSGKDVNLKKIQSEHLVSMKANEYSKTINAVYEIVKLIDVETHEVHGSVKLEFEWGNSREFLDMPPLDARAKVLTCVTPGDQSSPAHHQYQQLSALKMFSEGLTTQRICWAVEEYDVPLMIRVKELMKKACDSVVSLSDHQPEATEDVAATIEHLTVMKPRKDLDFTEKLWNILIECTVYQDLKDSLSYVFTNLKRVNWLPLINPNNKTKLAQFIRDCERNIHPTVPHLEGLTPLEYLVELGINKLRQDYFEFFLGEDFLQPHDIEPYRDTTLPLPEQIQQLEKLHSALELFLVTKHHLHLHGSYLAATARLALNYYRTHDLEPNHEFSLPVAAKAVRKILEGCAPSRWEMNLTSHCGKTGETGHTKIFAVGEPVASHVPLTNPNIDGGNESTAERTLYQLITVKESHNRVF